jgi:predicted nucleic acid-binding protein
MADYYADSSVLVKRHVNEIGSDWFRALADPASGNVIITSRVSIIEVYSAFNRRVREASLSPVDYAQLAADFALTYGTEYQIVELTVAVADRAREMLERHALRAYDSLQLASSLITSEAIQAAGLSAPIFLAADDGLLNAARAEGLTVDNPNVHP